MRLNTRTLVLLVLSLAFVVAAAACGELDQSDVVERPQVRLLVDDQVYQEDIYSYCWPSAEDNLVCDVDDAARANPAEIVDISAEDEIRFEVVGDAGTPTVFTARVLDGPGGTQDLSASDEGTFTTALEPGLYRVQVDAQFAGIEGNDAYISYVYGLNMAGAVAAAPTDTPTESPTLAPSDTPVDTAAPPPVESTAAPPTDGDGEQATQTLPRRTPSETEEAVPPEDEGDTGEPDDTDAAASTEEAPPVTADIEPTEEVLEPTVESAEPTMEELVPTVEEPESTTSAVEPTAEVAEPTVDDAEPTVVQPTEAPTQTPRPTATSTPTITPSPTVTPSPTPTVTPSPTMTPSATPTPSPEERVPPLELNYAGETFIPVGFQLCEPDESGERVCVELPFTQATPGRLTLMRGAAAALTIGGPRPLDVTIEYLTDMGIPTGQPELRVGDNNILFTITPEPGDYIMRIQVNWDDQSATYFFRVSIAG